MADDPRSRPGPPGHRPQRLLAFDLATGAVLAISDVSVPSECVCRAGRQPDPALALLAGDGFVAVLFVERPGQRDEQRFGLVVYA